MAKSIMLTMRLNLETDIRLIEAIQAIPKSNRSDILRKALIIGLLSDGQQVVIHTSRTGKRVVLEETPDELRYVDDE